MQCSAPPLLDGLSPITPSLIVISIRTGRQERCQQDVLVILIIISMKLTTPEEAAGAVYEDDYTFESIIESRDAEIFAAIQSLHTELKAAFPFGNPTSEDLLRAITSMFKHSSTS
jgi:hypothetical protein